MANTLNPYVYCPCCGGDLVTRADGLKACEKKVLDEPQPRGCGWVHWDNPVPAVATVVLNRDARRVLLVRRGAEPHKGKWCLPCGFVDRAEEPAEAAKREVFEEAGVLVKGVGILDARCPQPAAR